MESFESKTKTDFEKTGVLPENVEISILKHFWDTGIFSNKKKESISRFLRSVDIYSNFSTNELRILAKSLHPRNFKNKEKVFSRGEIGFGFYLIFRGGVDVIQEEGSALSVATLDKGDYFGELSLLQKNYQRDVTIIASSETMLLGLLKPDLEDLIEAYPRIAAKLLQSLSMVVTSRAFSLAEEIRTLKHKIKSLERHDND